MRDRWYRQGVLTNIRVREHESLVQLVLNPVHLTADDTEQGLAVYQDLDPVLLNRFVECTRPVHILQVVGQSTTAPVAHADLDQLWVGLVEQCVQSVHGGRCQPHGGLARS